MPCWVNIFCEEINQKCLKRGINCSSQSRSRFDDLQRWATVSLYLKHNEVQVEVKVFAVDIDYSACAK
jgi:hypothetical protein